MSDDQYASIRRIPYPYRAMLAICSDLDETPDRHAYLEIMKFLNTTEQTAMGRGLGLEVGNTIYFDMPPEQFSYWNTDDEGRRMIRTLIQSGHIDCLHSYGDLATSRAHAEGALAELSRHNCKLEVWIDHGRAPSNFGQDIMQGQGDVIGSKAYHADLTSDFGIRYVWCGRVTSIIGQDIPRKLCGIWNYRHPLTSGRTVLKELAKGLLAHGGSAKYAMHGPNQLMRPVTLQSGHKVHEFIRSNPHWAGVSGGDTAGGLAHVLTEKILSNLVEREGISIIYTHLGKGDRHELFKPPAKQALGLLARYAEESKILVTTTRRLLRYRRALDDITLSATGDNGVLKVNIITKDIEEDLEGLSIYIRIPGEARVTLNGSKVPNLRRNAPDSTGQASFSLPWRRLEFPNPDKRDK